MTVEVIVDRTTVLDSKYLPIDPQGPVDGMTARRYLDHAVAADVDSLRTTRYEELDLVREAVIPKGDVGKLHAHRKLFPSLNTTFIQSGSRSGFLHQARKRDITRTGYRFRVGAQGWGEAA